MTKRTIKTALGSYVDKRGVPTYGLQGAEVDVHPDFLEEFDEHNVANGDGEPHTEPRASVDMLSSPAAGAETSGTGSGLNTSVDEAEEPARPAAKRTAKK